MGNAPLLFAWKIMLNGNVGTDLKRTRGQHRNFTKAEAAARIHSARMLKDHLEDHNKRTPPPAKRPQKTLTNDNFGAARSQCRMTAMLALADDAKPSFNLRLCRL
jgi:hypothetical protein